MVTQEMSREGATEAGSAGGPRVRYVVDPTNSNQVIDMRHFFAIGQNGETYGLLVEILQWLPPNRDTNSAFDAQDFYSNFLGTLFFDEYYDHKSKKPLAEQLKDFFDDLKKKAEERKKKEEERKKKENQQN